MIYRLLCSPPAVATSLEDEYQVRSRDYIGAALILLALLPITNGSKLLVALNAFMQESTLRTAKVIDHVSLVSQDNKTESRAVYSVVEFLDDNGMQRSAKTNVARYPAPSKIGEQIVIRTHNTQLDDVRVDSFAGLWFESAFYLVPGFLTLVPGFLVIWRQRKFRVARKA